MNIPEPKCAHKDAYDGDSRIVSSHKDITKAKGKMASVRVCYREKCVEDAARWVAATGPGNVWVEGVKR